MNQTSVHALSKDEVMTRVPAWCQEWKKIDLASLQGNTENKKSLLNYKRASLI